MRTQHFPYPSSKHPQINKTTTGYSNTLTQQLSMTKKRLYPVESLPSEQKIDASLVNPGRNRSFPQVSASLLLEKSVPSRCENRCWVSKRSTVSSPPLIRIDLSLRLSASLKGEKSVKQEKVSFIDRRAGL